MSDQSAELEPIENLPADPSLEGLDDLDGPVDDAWRAAIARLQARERRRASKEHHTRKGHAPTLKERIAHPFVTHKHIMGRHSQKRHGLRGSAATPVDGADSKVTIQGKTHNLGEIVKESEVESFTGGTQTPRYRKTMTDSNIPTWKRHYFESDRPEAAMRAFNQKLRDAGITPEYRSIPSMGGNYATIQVKNFKHQGGGTIHSPEDFARNHWQIEEFIFGTKDRLR